MVAKFNAFRRGKVHVKSRQCATCIFRPNGFHLEPGRLQEMVDGALKADSAIICHDTLSLDSQAVCRGFYERHRTTPLVLATTLGLIEYD